MSWAVGIPEQFVSQSSLALKSFKGPVNPFSFTQIIVLLIFWLHRERITSITEKLSNLPSPIAVKLINSINKLWRSVVYSIGTPSQMHSACRAYRKIWSWMVSMKSIQNVFGVCGNTTVMYIYRFFHLQLCKQGSYSGTWRYLHSWPNRPLATPDDCIEFEVLKNILSACIKVMVYLLW